MLSNLELMSHHVDVLFRHDTENKITVVNEPPYEAAPLFYIGSTREGKIVRYSNTLDVDIIERIKHIVGRKPTDLAELIRLIGKVSGLKSFYFGPAYVFPIVRSGSCAEVIQVTDENKEILKSDFPYTFEDFDYKQPCFVIIKDNKVVSICCSARQNMKAAEASVFTNEHYRGRAYGKAVTTAWALEVQKQKRIALYSTSWDNISSQSLAEKLQLLQYGTDIHMS